MHHPERAPHRTAGEAFAEIDRIAEQMHRNGAPTDAVELVVVTVVGATADRDALLYQRLRPECR